MLLLTLLLQFSILFSKRTSIFQKFESNSSLPFWGVTEVYQYGSQMEAKAYGYTSYTHQVPMPLDGKFPIGSNSKLFAAVAMYQLQEQGLVNVTDDIGLYLDESDFKAFGFPNQTKYCPVLYGDSSNTCQTIRFMDLMSMSSGIIESLNCGYSNNSPFKQYCWDSCKILWLYNGTIGDYVGTFINVPLTFKPTTQYDYSNMNYLLISYFIEKLSGMHLSDYLQKYIFDVIPLKNTYFDQWTGYFGQRQKVIDGWYLMLNLDNPTESLGTGWIEPVLAKGIASAAGGIISTSSDMILWYSSLFNPNITIPKVFKTPQSIKSIVAPITKIGVPLINQYYAQGIFVTYNMSISTTWPININYEGGTNCCNTCIKMIPDNTQTIVTSFSNAPRMYIPNGEDGLQNIKYNINMNNCQMMSSGVYFVDDGGAGHMCKDLLNKCA